MHPVLAHTKLHSAALAMMSDRSDVLWLAAVQGDHAWQCFAESSPSSLLCSAFLTVVCQLVQPPKPTHSFMPSACSRQRGTVSAELLSCDCTGMPAGLFMHQLSVLPMLVHAPHQPASVLLCSLRGKDAECNLRVAAHFQTCVPSQLLMLLDLVAAVWGLSPADSRTACAPEHAGLVTG